MDFDGCRSAVPTSQSASVVDLDPSVSPTQNGSTTFKHHPKSKVAARAEQDNQESEDYHNGSRNENSQSGVVYPRQETDPVSPHDKKSQVHTEVYRTFSQVCRLPSVMLVSILLFLFLVNALPVNSGLFVTGEDESIFSASSP